jgi:hypothetical protein
MGMSRGEYKRTNKQDLKDDAIDFAKTAAGFGTMLISGPAGIAVGAGVAAYEAYDYVSSIDERATKSLATFLENTSVKNRSGKLSSDDAYDAAYFIRDLATDSQVRGSVGNAKDVESLIAEGVGSGVFLNTTDVEDFKQKSKDLVENYRQISHIMGKTGQEAVQIVGELVQAGMADSASQVRDIVQTAKTYGASSGFSQEEMLNIAQQGAEMVRGTGADLGEASLSAMTMVNFMRNQPGEVFNSKVIEQMGGTVQAAMLTQQMGHDYGNSQVGYLMNLAEMIGGYGSINSQEDMLKTIGGFANGADVKDILIAKEKGLQYINEKDNTLKFTELLKNEAENFRRIYNTDPLAEDEHL